MKVVNKSYINFDFKMRNFRLFVLYAVVLYSCQGQTEHYNKHRNKIEAKLEMPIYYCKIKSNEFFASYRGADFVNGDDIAHQLSNFVADTLGKHLKSEYKKKKYKKIDFKNTKIETLKYHPDSVYYTVKMPLLKVSACDAFTCVDHRGSWVALVDKTDSDLKEFIEKIKVNPNHKEEIKLFVTDFGLYEYWVQFRHPVIQENCK
jgi:hypothetical protein